MLVVKFLLILLFNLLSERFFSFFHEGDYDGVHSFIFEFTTTSEMVFWKEFAQTVFAFFSVSYCLFIFDNRQLPGLITKTAIKWPDHDTLLTSISFLFPGSGWIDHQNIAGSEELHGISTRDEIDIKMRNICLRTDRLKLARSLLQRNCHDKCVQKS